MAHTFKALTIAEYTAFAAKLPKYCPNTIFNFDGQSYTTPQVVTFIQTVLSITSAVTTAEGALKAARAAAAAAQAKEGVTVRGVRDIAALQFKSAPDVLTDLGITPRKAPKPLSSAARAAAEAKAKATRIARGTKGKKQKAAVTGNVTGVTIVPVTAPASGLAAAAAGTTPASASGTTTGGSTAPAVPAAASGGSAPHA
jgi:hypothetical protein